MLYLSSIFHTPFCDLDIWLYRWRNALLWRACFTTAVVAVVLRALIDLCNSGKCGLFGRGGGLIMFDVTSNTIAYHLVDLPPVILLAVIGGMLGSLYNFLLDKVLRIYDLVNEYVSHSPFSLSPELVRFHDQTSLNSRKEELFTNCFILLKDIVIQTCCFSVQYRVIILKIFVYLFSGRELAINCSLLPPFPWLHPVAYLGYHGSHLVDLAQPASRKIVHRWGDLAISRSFDALPTITMIWLACFSTPTMTQLETSLVLEKMLRSKNLRSSYSLLPLIS